MFNLFKKANNRKIINEIHNEEITHTLVELGMGLLIKDKDFENIEEMRCTFGYCIKGVDGKIESLFKIETDKITAYYQYVHDKIMRLNIDEDMFNTATDIFYSNNKDIKKELVGFGIRKK